MKKVLLSFVVAVFCFNMFAIANPIPVPVLNFSEIYWDGDEWIIELYISDYLEPEEIMMKCTDGTSLLREDLDFDGWGILLIKADSLQQPLNIEKEGDFLQFFYKEYNDEWICDYGMHLFGNYPGSMVNSPLPGQSLVNLVPYMGSTTCFMVKEANPSLGEMPNEITTYSMVHGYLLDGDSIAISSAELDSGFEDDPGGIKVTTGFSGNFQDNYVYPRNHKLIVHKDLCILHDTILLSIEPDSVYQLTITADTCIPYVGEREITATERHVEMQVYPNPFSSSLSVKISSLVPIKLTDAVLKIIDLKGKEMANKRIPSPWLTDLSLSLDREAAALSTGVYFLVLEDKSNVLVSRKIIHR